eukprot:538655-Pyramimonas_sp.AAC.1
MGQLYLRSPSDPRYPRGLQESLQNIQGDYGSRSGSNPSQMVGGAARQGHAVHVRPSHVHQPTHPLPNQRGAHPILPSGRERDRY